MTAYTREDQIDIRVTLDGVSYGASWDTIAGGARDANTVKIRVNGREIDIGGPGSRGDVTVGIQMSDLVAPWRRTFDSRVGRGALKVSWSLLDADGNVIDGPTTYTGTLKTCTPPDMDKSNTSPGPAKFQIVLAANEDTA